jgi:hypothetical protein
MLNTVTMAKIPKRTTLNVQTKIALIRMKHKWYIIQVQQHYIAVILKLG